MRRGRRADVRDGERRAGCPDIAAPRPRGGQDDARPRQRRRRRCGRSDARRHHCSHLPRPRQADWSTSKMGRTAHAARRGPRIIAGPGHGRPDSAPDIDELLAPSDGAGRALAQLEETLTDGYAQALSLEAERLRLERRLAARWWARGRSGGRAGRVDRRAACCAPTASSRGCAGCVAAAVRRPALASAHVRRGRCEPRRPPPGCGSRSGAS